MIIATNGLIVAACGLCMINNSVVILVGRLLYGMASGAYSVFCPKFVAEMTPFEFRGPFGTLSQFMCTFGIVVIACLGIPIPDKPVEEGYDQDSFMVKQYWRICWGLPVVFSAIQVLLMIFVFKYDTPVTLKERADYDGLTELFEKMYITEHVEMRVKEVGVT
jgi:MFS family permease